ncbi:hypothetical protein [Catalinimonas niigatensis]|uniref:hypothetical protein n=1 Tax=Catalinimonas niigatensis TaxID=1397264 RepID=UPI002665266D|nr:hypothetical protein [Catalinimonas niigatensis]WPP51033.1 hypothetical protein PZB72_01320 [Catalinimonas niigatensis]
MSYIKVIGWIALILGTLVLMVASYISFSTEQTTIEPFALGASAILAGFICMKKSEES